jgi:hypothetical protein
LRHTLDAQRADTVGPGNLGQNSAVVEEVAFGGAYADVARTVELGADLADFGCYDFVVAG